MGQADAQYTAMVEAFEAHEDLEIDTFRRIDIFDAIVRAGLKLHFRPLDAAGLYLPASAAIRPGVLVNSQHPLALQRYSAAHEYGHHVFDHGAQVDRDGEPRGTGAGMAEHEMLAEMFAAWFLMPPETIESCLRHLGLECASTPQEAYALSLRLGTSYRATCNRIPELQGWRDQSVKSIKQELTLSTPPGGWRNDVWVLTELDADVPIVARAGDSILVSLPGWDVDEIPSNLSVELVSGPSLLSTPRWSVDLPHDCPEGSFILGFRDSGTSVAFEILVTRPRSGRYIAAMPTKS